MGLYAPIFLMILAPLPARAVTLTPVSGNYASLNAAATPGIVYYAISGSSGNCASPTSDPTGTVTVLSPTTGDLQFTIQQTTDVGTICSGTQGSTPSANCISIRAYVGSNPIALVTHGTSYNGDYTQVSYGNANGAVVEFGISLPAVSGTSGYCKQAFGGTCPAGPNAFPSTQTVTIGLTAQGSTLTGNADFTTLQIVLVDCPPRNGDFSLYNPTLNFSIIPGDGRLRIVDQTSPPSLGDPVPISKVVIFGTSQGVQPTVANSDQKVSVAGSSVGTTQLTGLTNDKKYCFSYGFVNAGGFMSALPAIIASQDCATPSEIDGFLNRSSCFIATAAYGDERDGRLETLRQFRDQLLLRSLPGRGFTRWYYSWSPPAARWLLRHQKWRALARLALIPVVEGARGAIWLRENLQGLSLLPDASAATDTGEVQPYIESLKRKYGIKPTPAPAATPAPKPAATELKAGEVQPYIEKLRAREGLPPSESAPKPLVPPGKPSGSAESAAQPYLESVKAGRELEPKFRKTVDRAAGMSLVTSSNFNISSGTSQAASFNSVYNTGGRYNPGADFFYERQLLRSRYFGSLGPVVHAGFVYTQGLGVFVKNGSQSQDTHFQFVAIPVSLGASYRLSQLRFVVPFAQASVVAIPMMETRDDDKPARRALARSAALHAGAAFNLDWIGRRDAWARYDDYGFLHTYLMAQAEIFQSLGGAIRFNYQGLYAGLLFEF